MNTAAIIIGIGVVSYLFTCWSIVDVAIKHFGAIEKKAIWAIVTFVPFIGWVVYFLFGRKKGVLQARVSNTPE